MRYNFNLIDDKKGDIASIIYITIFLAIAGIMIFLVTHLNIILFTEIENNLNGTSKYNGTEAQIVASDMVDMNNGRMWDYAFLGIFMGCLLSIGLSAYAVRISPIFYWVYGMMAIIVLVLGTALSNFWQDFATEAEFTSTINNFPITNTLLGSYYPMVITAVVIIAMIILFGKPPSNNPQEEAYL